MIEWALNGLLEPKLVLKEITLERSKLSPAQAARVLYQSNTLGRPN